MRQKFSISRAGRKELVIKEFSELEKNEYTRVYEATYDLSTVGKAARENIEALGGVLRSEVFFPPAPIIEKIASAVMEILESKDTDTVEVSIDDNNVGDVDDTGIDLEDDDAEAEDLDDILNDDDDDDDLVADTDE